MGCRTPYIFMCIYVFMYLVSSFIYLLICNMLYVIYICILIYLYVYIPISCYYTYSSLSKGEMCPWKQLLVMKKQCSWIHSEHYCTKNPSMSKGISQPICDEIQDVIEMDLSCLHLENAFVKGQTGTHICPGPYTTQLLQTTLLGNCKWSFLTTNWHTIDWFRIHVWKPSFHNTHGPCRSTHHLRHGASPIFFNHDKGSPVRFTGRSLRTGWFWKLEPGNNYDAVG